MLGRDEKTGSQSALSPGVNSSQVIDPPNEPLAPEFTGLRRLGGILRLAASGSEWASLYPHAARAFGAGRLSSLAGTSCVVGMIVPGLHSTFSGLDISLHNDSAATTGDLTFLVQAVNDRFRLARVAFTSPHASGTLEALYRSPPVRQLSMSDASSCVSSREFAGMSALVIGGSRGLGEATAKLIAAGGGQVAITYTVGNSDAEAVASEIGHHGHACQCLRYDVRLDASEQLKSLGAVPTHIFYFATPLIARRKSGLFDPVRFAEFSTFYLQGFYQLAIACAELNVQGIKIFYPSTTFLEERPAAMTEYAMTKAAGEVLCAEVSRFLPRVQVFARRLPRLPTDQTGYTALSAPYTPQGILLPIIREMSGAGRLQ
jgi:hypothetical protein